MSAAGPPQGANCAPPGGSAAAQPQAWGDHTSLKTTASQTVGPYLHIGLAWLSTDNLLGPGVSGEPVTIEGRITDADGRPVDDALVEIWQANAHGRYDHPDDTRDVPLEPGFKGFGRVPTNASGGFRFTTIKPGRVPASTGASSATESQGASASTLQAPHINVTIFMRGMLKHLTTRIYFPGEPANADDPVLALVPAERRDTLIAKAIGPHAFAWNVVLQGEGETVFLEY